MTKHTDHKQFVHFWIELRKYPRLYKPGLFSCVFCGVVKPREDKYIKNCYGLVKIGLR